MAVSLNAYTSLSGSLSTSAASRATTTKSSTESSTVTSTSDSKSGVSISITARQLAEAAERAEQRDASMSMKELGNEAERLLDQVYGDEYYAKKQAGLTQTPQSQESELIERAQQATQLVNNFGRGTNPFADLSSEQLSLIIYDDSGAFTADERHAAFYEQYGREEAWRQQVVANAQLEYATTGKRTNFYEECISFYDNLPKIEQAQYPADYVARLQARIQMDESDSSTGQPISFIDLVAEIMKKNSEQNLISE